MDLFFLRNLDNLQFRISIPGLIMIISNLFVDILYDTIQGQFKLEQEIMYRYIMLQNTDSLQNVILSAKTRNLLKK